MCGHNVLVAHGRVYRMYEEEFKKKQNGKPISNPPVTKLVGFRVRNGRQAVADSSPPVYGNAGVGGGTDVAKYLGNSMFCILRHICFESFFRIRGNNTVHRLDGAEHHVRRRQGCCRNC